MSDDGFPTDAYTPHGYLANPFAVAHSWSDGQGGCLRTSRERVGLGWQLPWALRAQASVDLIVMLASGDRQIATRTDFEAAGLTSPHHSANLMVYQWEAFGRRWEAAYARVESPLLDDGAGLGLLLRWEPAADAAHAPPDTAPTPPDVTLTVALVGWRQDRSVTAERASQIVDLGAPFGQYGLLADGGSTLTAGDAGDGAVSLQVTISAADRASGEATAIAATVTPAMVRLREHLAGKAPPVHEAVEERAVAALVQDAVRRARTDDAAFWQGAARLEGDWPPAWRRGWVYDTETTRMCLFPPGGIFADVWPAWMVQWPRAVVAEGTLDMARFAYASPELALRATLSLFRDAEAPNVPCVFQHGAPNMVAADGAVCGTSPAWCVPLYNVERLFAFTLDRDWLAQLYPYLTRYVEWWLTERTDADGWAVYKCTWEAGEDDTPRLDPERRGDNVVSAFVRPVELQASLALSAGALARFASVLGRPDEAARWRQVEADYLERTRQLWDPDAGRFRDWDARAGRFLAPAGEASYWGIDPCRFSALAFTPLLAGLADEAYRVGLQRELAHYAGPPWTLWPSWSYAVLEAAPRTGDRAFAGRVAAEIVGRVYAELDRRAPAAPAHPTPGVAREYWPLDLDAWASCEGYGWGANTASLLVRQVFGFLEGPYTDLADSSAVTFALRPRLPERLLRAGREYRLAGLPYRGARLTVGYRVAHDQAEGDAAPVPLTLLIQARTPTRCRVLTSEGAELHRSAGSQERHEAPGQNGADYLVELRFDQPVRSAAYPGGDEPG